VLAQTANPEIVADVDVAAGPVIAIVVSELLHVPPMVDELSIVVLPAQSVFVPVMAAGIAPTVTIRVTKQPPAV